MVPREYWIKPCTSVLFLAMSELAHMARSIVFSQHAGFLSSYASDKRARLCRAYRLVEGSEDHVELLYSIHSVDHVEIGSLRDAVVERIRLFAPELLPVPDPSMPFCCQVLSHVRRVYMKRVCDDARNMRRRIKR